MVSGASISLLTGAVQEDYRSVLLQRIPTWIYLNLSSILAGNFFKLNSNPRLVGGIGSICSFSERFVVDRIDSYLGRVWFDL